MGAGTHSVCMPGGMAWCPGMWCIGVRCDKQGKPRRANHGPHPLGPVRATTWDLCVRPQVHRSGSTSSCTAPQRVTLFAAPLCQEEGEALVYGPSPSPCQAEDGAALTIGDHSRVLGLQDFRLSLPAERSTVVVHYSRPSPSHTQRCCEAPLSEPSPHAALAPRASARSSQSVQPTFPSPGVKPACVATQPHTHAQHTHWPLEQAQSPRAKKDLPSCAVAWTCSKGEAGSSRPPWAAPPRRLRGRRATSRPTIRQSSSGPMERQRGGQRWGSKEAGGGASRPRSCSTP